MLLAQAARDPGARAVNSNAALPATPTGGTLPASAPPAAPDATGSGSGAAARQSGGPRGPAAGADGNAGAPTGAADAARASAPPATLATVSALTTAGTLIDARTAANASALDAASALNPAAAATHLPAAAAGASSNLLSLQSQLRAAWGTPEWVDELGAQLTWMAHHGIGSASLKVSPPGLGPIEVRIAVQGSAATVWFGAAQADTRAALEQALPRLHELFGAQGLALADASVSRESPREQRDSSSALWGGAGAPQTPADCGAQAATALRLALLDLYA